MATLYINGVPTEFKLASLDMKQAISGRSLLRATIENADAMVRPGVPQTDDPVMFADDIAVTFNGLALTPGESAIGDSTGRAISFDAVDNSSLATRRAPIEVYAAGSTAEELFDDLVTKYLAVFGVVIDPLMDSGNVIGKLEFDGSERLSEICDKICALASTDGWVWKIDEDFVFRAYDPVTEPAPWGVSEAAPNHIGNLTVERSRGDYANSIIFFAGEGTREILDEHIPGDGATRIFPFSYPVASMVGVANVYDPAFVQGFSVGRYGIDAMPWTFDPDYAVDGERRGALRQAVSEPLISAAGYVTMSGNYVAQYPIRIVRTDASAFAVFGGVGPWEKVVRDPKLFDRVTATAITEAMLAKSLPIRTKIGFTTLRRGLEVGQSISIVWPLRDVDGTYLITEIVTRDLDARARNVSFEAGPAHPHGALQYTVTAENLGYRGSWRDLYKLFASSSSGGTSSVGTVVVGGGGTTGASALPFPLGGSIDALRVAGTSGDARDAQPVPGTHAPGRTAVPWVGTRAGASPGSITAEIWDDLGNVVSAGTANTTTAAVWADMPAFVMAAGRTYRLRYAATAGGFVQGYLYVA